MKAWELLSLPHRWTKFALARDGAGCSVDPLDPQAVSWCAEGAIRKCYNLPREAQLWDCPAWRELMQTVAPRLAESVPWWNDGSSHHQVVTVLKDMDI